MTKLQRFNFDCCVYGRLFVRVYGYELFNAIERDSTNNSLNWTGSTIISIIISKRPKSFGDDARCIAGLIAY